jgi:uncharacterized membrane protein
MCGLGFVGLLILLFYMFIIVVLLIFAGQHLCMKMLKKLRDRRSRRAHGGAETFEEPLGRKH